MRGNSGGDNMKFIYCYDEESKEKLISKNYSFIREVKWHDKMAFLFINDGVEDKLLFSNSNIELSNKMCF